MTSMHRTSSDLAGLSRSAQRKKRLLEIENEQRIEEAEALKMTEEQRQTLMHSFKSVKVEFSDLDGLTWTHSALRKRCKSHATRSPPSLRSPTFAIFSNADLASFNPEDTIRASASRSRPRISYPHNSSRSLFSSPKCDHRDGSRSRSPVKGLFNNPPPSDNKGTSVNPCPPPRVSELAERDTTVRGRIRLPPRASTTPSSLAPACITYSPKSNSEPKPKRSLRSLPTAAGSYPAEPPVPAALVATSATGTVVLSSSEDACSSPVTATSRPPGLTRPSAVTSKDTQLECQSHDRCRS